MTTATAAMFTFGRPQFISKKVARMELATLSGTEKQVKWAEKLRESAIAASQDLLQKLDGQLRVNRKGDWNQLSKEAVDRMYACKSAKQWIEAKTEIDELTKTLKSYTIRPSSVVLVTQIGDKLKAKKVIG